ncbi:unnamed protein product [Ectocarpus sp. 12 AP-2014]
MKSALEQGRIDAKAVREKLVALETELNEAKDEAQEQRERATRAERAYATLLEEGRGRASSCEGDDEQARSSTLQRELQAEEEGGGVEKSSVKVGGLGGLTQSYSKDGAPEWKWLGNCPKDGKRSPSSSISSPPPLLPRVSSAATNSLDPTWHFDPSPILSSGIISVQAVGSTASSPVLTSEFPEPGRIAALASRIETRQASPDDKSGGSNLTSPVLATVPGIPGKTDVGPLATALPLPTLAATTAGGPALRSRSNSGRWVMKRCSSSTSLTLEPTDGGPADGGIGGGSGSCSAGGFSSGGSRNCGVLRRSSSSAATAPQQEGDGGVAPAVPRNVPRPAGPAAVGKDDDALASPANWEQGGKRRPALLGKSSGGSSISSSSSFGSDDSGFCSALGSCSPDAGSVPPKGGRAGGGVGVGDEPLMRSKDQKVPSQVDGGEEGGVGGSSCSEATLPASPDKGGGCG